MREIRDVDRMVSSGETVVIQSVSNEKWSRKGMCGAGDGAWGCGKTSAEHGSEVGNSGGKSDRQSMLSKAAARKAKTAVSRL